MSSRLFRLPLASAAGQPVLTSSLLRNAGWLLFDRGFRFLIVFASGVLVTRYLGPADAGTLSNALALAVILAGLCDLGLDSIVRLEVINSPADRGRVLGTAVALRLMAAPLAFVVFAFSLAGDPKAVLHRGLIVGIGCTLLSPAILIFDSWFQSQTQARYSVWAQTAGLTAGAALRVIGILVGASLSWFGWVAGLELLLVAAVLIAVYRSQAPDSPRWTFDREIARKLLSRSWALALTNLSILIYTRIDVVLLTELRGEHETGLYTAATRLTEAGYVLPMIAVNTLFPVLARQHAENRAHFSRTMHHLLVGVAWTGVGASIVIAICSSVLIHLLYGPAFAESGTVLAILAFNCALAGLGAVRAQWLVLNHLQRFGLYYVGMGALLNLALNAALIPKWGATGAAFASLATQGFVVVVAPLCFRETRESVTMFLRALTFTPPPNPPPAQ